MKRIGRHFMSINNFRPAIHPIDRTSSCDSRCRYHHSLSLFRLSHHVGRVVSWRSRASSRHKTPSWQWGPSYHRQCGSERRRHLHLYGSCEIRWNGEQGHPVDCQQWVLVDKNGMVSFMFQFVKRLNWLYFSIFKMIKYIGIFNLIKIDCILF